jgi:hypothetical protein
VVELAAETGPVMLVSFDETIDRYWPEERLISPSALRDAPDETPDPVAQEA